MLRERSHVLLAIALPLALGLGAACAPRSTPPGSDVRSRPEVAARAPDSSRAATIIPIASPDAIPAMPRSLPGYDTDLPVDSRPQFVHRVGPTYPEAAREARIQGLVVLRALVLRDGSVGALRVVESIPGLDEAAIECAWQWRFSPATEGDTRLPAWVAIPIRFSLH